MFRDLTLHRVLVVCFGLPVELRYVICKTYFPFLPNSTRPLTCIMLLRLSLDLQVIYTVAEMIDDYALELTSNGKVIAFNVAKFKGIYMCLVKEGNVEDENKPGFYQLTIPVERITATTVEDELHFIVEWYNNRLLHCIDTS